MKAYKCALPVKSLLILAKVGFNSPLGQKIIELFNNFIFYLNYFSLKSQFPFKSAIIIKNGKPSYDTAGERVDSATLAEFMFYYLPAVSLTAPTLV